MSAITVRVNGNVVTRSHLLRTGGGVTIESADDTTISDNGTSELTGNLVVHNGQYGIEAVKGTGDGGGNVAIRNAHPIQCVKIRCTVR